ncbi:MAG: hypothetical protein ACREV2_10275 [Burkholderiales bacterium]
MQFARSHVALDPGKLRQLANLIAGDVEDVGHRLNIGFKVEPARADYAGVAEEVFINRGRPLRCPVDLEASMPPSASPRPH